MQCRVLFVDDEPSIRSIYGMLGDFLGNDYLITTVAGPEEAKAHMTAHSADVVISDLVMPGCSGAELLMDISRKHPACARIAVSGFADQITMAKCLSVAHRYFTKPFHPVALTSTIQELHSTGGTVNEKLRQTIGAIQSLPIPSENFFLLTKALNSHVVSLDSIAVVVEKDPSLCSKLLQAANSAMFGSRQRCLRIVDAIQTLGLQAIRTLLLSVQIFELCPGKKFKPFLDKLWRHSLEISGTARHLAQVRGLSAAEIEEAFLGGLLHDLGKVVLASSAPELYEPIITGFAPDAQAFRDAELESFGANHAEAGAYLLKLWGLPEPLVEIVKQHHAPCSDTQNETLLLTLKAAHELSRSSSREDFEQWCAKERPQAEPRREYENRSVLVASTDRYEVERLSSILQARGFTIFPAFCKSETLQLLHDLTFHLALLDENLLPGCGNEAARKFRQVNGSVRIIMLRQPSTISASVEGQSTETESISFGAAGEEILERL
jgi:putative nucleotidyltransferase with HDIG domain